MLECSWEARATVVRFGSTLEERVRRRRINNYARRACSYERRLGLPFRVGLRRARAQGRDGGLRVGTHAFSVGPPAVICRAASDHADTVPLLPRPNLPCEASVKQAIERGHMREVGWVAWRGGLAWEIGRRLAWEAGTGERRAEQSEQTLCAGRCTHTSALILDEGSNQRQSACN